MDTPDRQPFRWIGYGTARSGLLFGQVWRDIVPLVRHPEAELREETRDGDEPGPDRP